MNTVAIYGQEVRMVRSYLGLILTFIFLGYSVYLFLDDTTVARLGEEDQLFEYLTAALFLATALVFGLIYREKKGLLVLLLAIAMFIGAGEEISWGQRIFNFATPESLESVNVQREFNLHNIYIFNGTDLQDNMKEGADRLLQIDLLFRIFIMMFGILLPILVYHVPFFSQLASKLKVPVPPLTLGIAFLINWLCFRIILSYFLPIGKAYQYYDTIAEFFECGSAFILFILAIYFFSRRHEDFLGRDIKQLVFSER